MTYFVLLYPLIRCQVIRSYLSSCYPLLVVFDLLISTDLLPYHSLSDYIYQMISCYAGLCNPSDPV